MYGSACLRVDSFACSSLFGVLFLIRQDGWTICNGGEDDDGLCLHDAGMVLDAGEEFFQCPGGFGEDFQ